MIREQAQKPLRYAVVEEGFQACLSCSNYYNKNDGSITSLTCKREGDVFALEADVYSINSKPSRLRRFASRLPETVVLCTPPII